MAFNNDISVENSLSYDTFEDIYPNSIPACKSRELDYLVNSTNLLFSSLTSETIRYES